MDKRVIVPSFAPEGIGGAGGFTLGTSGAWPEANFAFFYPFRLSRPMVVTSLFVNNGATASGNFDIGLYTAERTRLMSTGSRAQSGTNVVQEIAVPDFTIGPACFYLALVMDGTTGTIIRSGDANANTPFGRVLGIVEQASAFPLPATATFAVLTHNLWGYIFGLSGFGA